MPNPIDKAAIDRLRALDEAATPGPWTEDDGFVHSEPVGRLADLHVEMRMRGEKPDFARPDTCVAKCQQYFFGIDGPQGQPEFEANADLISEARNALPALLAAAEENAALRVALENERPKRGANGLYCTHGAETLCDGCRLKLAQQDASAAKKRAADLDKRLAACERVVAAAIRFRSAERNGHRGLSAVEAGIDADRRELDEAIRALPTSARPGRVEETQPMNGGRS